jgi:hypothetical protein
MATNEIKLGINLRQNKNSKNSGFGKYYPEVDTQTTLTLRGFAKHMSDHGSIYSLDLIEGVLKKITQCLPELISQGVPVRLDPLGTFLPTCTVDKPVLNIPAMESANPDNVVKGVHIRFLPYGVEDENITSRRFKDEYCSLEFRNIIDAVEVTIDGKKKKVQTLKPIATAVAEWKQSHGSLTPDPSPTGEGSENQGGSGSGNGTTDSTDSTDSTNSGNSGSQNQQSSVAAPVIGGDAYFQESTQVTITGPEGASIYYSESGDDPDTTDTLYTQPFTISEDTTVKAIAVKDGQTSQVTVKNFTKGSDDSGGFETAG